MLPSVINITRQPKIRPVIAIQRPAARFTDKEIIPKMMGKKPKIKPPASASLSHLPDGSEKTKIRATMPVTNDVMEDQ